MKKLIYILIAFITLSACKKDDNNAPLLETKWELVSVKYKFEEESDDDFSESYNIETEDDLEYIQFKSDNIVTQYEKEKDENNIFIDKRVPFSVNGNIITSNIIYGVSNFTFSISGNTLTITTKSDGYVNVYVYRKTDIDLSNAIENQ